MTTGRRRAWSWTVLVVIGVAGLAFEAGRRYPFERLNELLGISEEHPLGPWTVASELGLDRNEAGAAVWRDRLYVFGGFDNRADLPASSRVDVWDPTAGRWSRAGDLPSPVTHANAAVVGDTIWFAGGFIGAHPGPATDRVAGYEPLTDTWFVGPSLPALRGGGVLVADRRTLHYFGGYGPDRVAGVGDHWALDLDAWLATRATWQSRAPMPGPRGHLTAAAAEGFVYLIGGTSSHDPYAIDVDRVDRYDPTLDTWTSGADLPYPFSHNEPSTIVRDGEIWLVGGRSIARGEGSSKSVLVYDPTDDRWTAWRSLPMAVRAPVAAVIGDDLFVAGGALLDLTASHPMWRISMKPGWWSGDSLPESLGEVAAGLIGDRLIVVGQGKNVTLAYDVAGGHWESAERRARRPAAGNHHAAEVLDGKLVLLGGLDYGTGQMQIYDPVADRWAFGPELPFQAGSSASAVIGGRLYVGGGIDQEATIDDAAVYDPSTGRWSAIAPMPLPRNHAASATDGSRWYVFGGRGPGSGDGNFVAEGFDDVQIYDPTLDRWTVSRNGPEAPAPMPVGRGGTGKAVYVQGRFYVIGGETLDDSSAPEGVYSRVDVFDPRTNEWNEGPPLPTPRHGIFPVVRGNRIYVAGGGTRAGESSSRVLEVLDLPPQSR